MYLFLSLNTIKSPQKMIQKSMDVHYDKVQSNMSKT